MSERGGVSPSSAPLPESRDSQSASFPDAILTSLRQLHEQWKEESERLRLRKGQMTREKRGHEVLFSCADALASLLALAESQQQETQEKRP
jgi:hypothetical protein